MTLVAITGSGATTTTLAMAATWPSPSRPLVVEADPAGGCLSAWLDVRRAPGIADVVATSGGFDLDALLGAVQTSGRNIDVVVAPVRALEAAATVHAVGALWPDISSSEGLVALVDVGRSRPGSSAAVEHADVLVLAHRQHAATPAAAVVGIERLAEHLESTGTSRPVVVALIGEAPYGAGEVADFLGVPAVGLPDDPFAAAALAGRPSGTRRMQGSPLLRAARRLDAAVLDLLTEPRVVTA